VLALLLVLVLLALVLAVVVIPHSHPIPVRFPIPVLSRVACSGAVAVWAAPGRLTDLTLGPIARTRIRVRVEAVSVARM